MSYYTTAPSGIDWTLTDLHQADLRLKEAKGTEYAQILGTLRLLATAYPAADGAFKVLLVNTYANLREVLRGH